MRIEREGKGIEMMQLPKKQNSVKAETPFNKLSVSMLCCLQSKTSLIGWVKANGKAREKPFLFDITLVQTLMAN